MNCRQGDKALIIKAVDPEDVGKMVTCVRFVGKATVVHPLGFTASSVRSDIWEIDREVTWSNMKGDIVHTYPLVPDAYLMPIRPDDAKQEWENQCNVPVAVQQ